MKTFSSINRNSSVLTKPIITTLICLVFVFIPYLIIWILAGEYNFDSKNNIYKSLVDIQFLLGSGQKKSLSWEMYTIIFSLFGFELLLPFILHFISFGKIKIDTLPFIYSLSSIAIMLFITWLIPYDENNNAIKSLIIFARIFIIIVTGCIVFISTNKLSNFVIANSSFGFDAALAFKSRQADEDKSRQELNKIKKNSRKKEYIEIKKERKVKK